MVKIKSHPGLKDRPVVLTRRRNLKMSRSSHAYVRGSTQKFYEWLRSAEGLKVPQGPPIWICGDCHVGNLGPIASTKGLIDIQIRDLDQTVIGNPAHDLIRLGLSLASAARGSNLPGVVTLQMIEQVVEGYEQAFQDETDKTGAEAGGVDLPEVVRLALRDADTRNWKSLARERIKDTKPTIPLGKRFWPLSKPEREAISTLFKDEKVRRLVTALRSRDDDASVEVLDAAYWVKGCSSLGLLRYAVLVGVGDETCLIDIKEAVKAAAPAAPDADMPKDNAERVVQGAWHLSPSLGDRMLAAKLGATSVFMRELLPQDLKFDIEYLPAGEAMKVARFLASVVGKAHARQMDAPTRKTWLKTLTVNRSKTLDAPSWLWAAVVELLMSHEGAYLEHCRKYALTATRAETADARL